MLKSLGFLTLITETKIINHLNKEQINKYADTSSNKSDMTLVKEACQYLYCDNAKYNSDQIFVFLSGVLGLNKGEDVKDIKDIKDKDNLDESLNNQTNLDSSVVRFKRIKYKKANTENELPKQTVNTTSNKQNNIANTKANSKANSKAINKTNYNKSNTNNIVITNNSNFDSIVNTINTLNSANSVISTQDKRSLLYKFFPNLNSNFLYDSKTIRKIRMQFTTFFSNRFNYISKLRNKRIKVNPSNKSVKSLQSQSINNRSSSYKPSPITLLAATNYRNKAIEVNR